MPEISYTFDNTRLSQKFGNILVTWSKIWQFQTFLSRSGRWWITLNTEMLRSPDTLWIYLCLGAWPRINVKFASMAWCTASESMPDCQGSCKLGKISWRTIWLLYCDQLHLLHDKCFWLFLRHYSLIQTCRAKVLELDDIACSSVQLLNHAQSEAMHSVSVHQIPWYYQAQWVPPTVWTVSLM